MFKSKLIKKLQKLAISVSMFGLVLAGTAGYAAYNAPAGTEATKTNAVAFVTDAVTLTVHNADARVLYDPSTLAGDGLDTIGSWWDSFSPIIFMVAGIGVLIALVYGFKAMLH